MTGADSDGRDQSAMTAQAFVTKWANVAVLPATELATAQSFVRDLCDLLAVPHPHATAEQDYQFERPVTFLHGDGSASPGRIDCYRRGAFVLEAKKLRVAPGSRAVDEALLRARSQAERYARALPAEDGRPPFLVVIDVGRAIEIYAEFTRTGGTYTPFPDPLSHRIDLDALQREDVRERLRAVWMDPMSLDPARASARVTREIAQTLAEVARSLEGAGHQPQRVAEFLSRCLFTMFAEDIGLLPANAFTELLEKHGERPDVLGRMLTDLWTAMDRGDFCAALAEDVLQFNGKLFKDREALPLTIEHISLLVAAARADWKQVEPAIFGTLLERALDPEERHALGAHFTPRAYVERLVMPTVIEPLREDWVDAQAAALILAREAEDETTPRARERKLEAAREQVHTFLHRLTSVRVLDPACGSGNFLYVTLEHLKRLEGEVLNQLDDLGDSRGRLDLAGVTVDPHQLLGIEINPRAAAIAEMVLWIGYLQWHFRTRGNVQPPQPVLKDFRNIECRDAVLAWDRVELVVDESGRPVTQWDGRTMKPHPVTGEPVPDEAAQRVVERYVNPRRAEWPEADFVVGNPPFIGSKRMRDALGDGYVDALQAAWPEIPEATDFVTRWWHSAATLVRECKLQRFGLIVTNSLRQAYVRRAIEPHLTAEPPLSLVFAIPDHPWVDSADGAAVRISMTVGQRGPCTGLLASVIRECERATGEGEDLVEAMTIRAGRIFSNLSIGADTTTAQGLRANDALCSVGMKTIGSGFLIDADKAEQLGLGSLDNSGGHIRPYLTGKEWVSKVRGRYVLDFFQMPEDQVLRQFPRCYQHLLDRVKPERDHNRNRVFREKWWVIGHPRPQFRSAVRGLERYIVTVETQKHRFFGFLNINIVPDSTLVTIASDDAFLLGVLSSRLHVVWALALGGTLEDRPRYNKSLCFETFPFPSFDSASVPAIRELAEAIDLHRKTQQARHHGLALTGVYNVLEKLRSGAALTASERSVHEQGLVSVLGGLHDRLDRAVFAAYGWDDLATALVGRPGATTPLSSKPADQEKAEEALLERLVALNVERAAGETRGQVRWLRPDYQAPEARQAARDADTETATGGQVTATSVIAAAPPRPWPKAPVAQARAVADVLAEAPAPLTEDDIAARFKARGRWRERLPALLEMLVVLGKARAVEDAAGASRYVID